MYNFPGMWGMCSYPYILLFQNRESEISPMLIIIFISDWRKAFKMWGFLQNLQFDQIMFASSGLLAFTFEMTSSYFLHKKHLF